VAPSRENVTATCVVPSRPARSCAGAVIVTIDVSADAQLGTVPAIGLPRASRTCAVAPFVCPV